MKRGFKRIGAVLLTVAMALTMNLTVFAAETLTGGVVGDTEFTKDSPTEQDKSVLIQKELTVFNPDETSVYGPAFTYTYTVTPGDANKKITDAASQHDSNLSTEAMTLAGITTGVKVNSGTAGGASSAVGTLVWENGDVLNASATGTANYKNVEIDFSNVVFTQPGVYRYVITETPAAADTSYAAAGITETTGSRARYLDVYVMRSAAYTDGSTKDDWTIYGYVCFYNNTAIDAADLSATPIKTTGFVVGTTDGSTAFIADQYHTYNLTIGKTLTGDPTMTTHKFPFDVAWVDGGATGTFQLGVKTTGTTQVTADNSALKKVGGADAMITADKDGTPSIANGGTIKYIGIPQAASATVTERNDVTGTTYATTATETIGSGSATDVVFDVASTGELSSDKKTATIDDTETAVYVESTTVTADSNYAIQFTNNLSIISPTGFVVRFAPYMLVLMGGIFLIVLGVVLYKRTNKEEA